MRLCFVVDYRSPIARNWINHFVETGHEVHVVSTFPSAPDEALASLTVVPVAFGVLATRPTARRYFAASGQIGSSSGGAGVGPIVGRAARRVAGIARELLPWIAPLDVGRFAGRLRRVIDHIQPDLVHAMRIPYEAMLAARALETREVPLVASVWGNDFTLFATRYPLTGRATRRALRRIDALHTDCERDHRLASAWGWSAARPAIVLPGSGGVQPDLFHPGEVSEAIRTRWNVPAGRPVVFNPRNFRPTYVRNDTFFAAVEQLMRERPEVIVMCVGMASNGIAEAWKESLGSRGDGVRLLPAVTRPEMADLFRLADVTVSPSTHDGTPNTLLEAMACGAFPVAGDIESIREWITHGENGLLCDPANPAELAAMMRRAVDERELRERAALRNRRLIAERASYPTVMAAAEQFYASLIERRTSAAVPALTGAS